MKWATNDKKDKFRAQNYIFGKTNMLMMVRALKYTIYDKIVFGYRIPLRICNKMFLHQVNIHLLPRSQAPLKIS